MSVPLIRWLLIAGLWVAIPAQAGELVQGIDADARLPFWSWNDEDISLRLVQRLPDQTRGFFLARGFDSKTANDIAVSCVFQTIFRNITTVPASKNSGVDIDLANWRVIANGRNQPLKMKAVWGEEWQRRGVPEPPRIAFRWALFPDRQHFEPGDYNWGMIIFDLPPGASFDLQLAWIRNGISHQVSIPGMQCAADIHPEEIQ